MQQNMDLKDLQHTCIIRFCLFIHRTNATGKLFRRCIKKQWAEPIVAYKSSPLGSPMRSRFVSPTRYVLGVGSLNVVAFMPYSSYRGF